MTRELDPKGLEAAEKYALSEGWVAPDDDDIAFLVGIIRAYLDAARTSTQRCRLVASAVDKLTDAELEAMMLYRAGERDA